MSKNTNIEWVDGVVQTEVYTEINQCPIIAVNLTDENVQVEIEQRGTKRNSDEVEFDSEVSDDDDGVGEKTKSHRDRNKILKERIDYTVRPVPCERIVVKKKISVKLNYLNYFIFNKKNS